MILDGQILEGIFETVKILRLLRLLDSVGFVVHDLNHFEFCSHLSVELICEFRLTFRQ